MGATLLERQPLRWAPGINHQDPLAQGLVGAWPFWEGSGDKVFDYSGSGNTGTLTNGPTWTTSEFGKCLYFDGAAEREIIVGQSPELVGMPQLSLSAWVKYTGDPDTAIEKNVFDCWQSGDNNFLLRWSPANNRWEFYIDTSAGTASVAANDLPNVEDAECFLVASYDGTVMRISQDGQYSANTTAHSGDIDAGTEDLSIGGQRAGAADFWTGYLANIMLLRRAATLGEIKSLYSDPWRLYRRPTLIPVLAGAGVEIITGTVCWGHVTGVTEDNVLTFSGNWAGTGDIVNPGAADNEEIELDEAQYMQISGVVQTGINTVTIQKNKYGAGDAAVVLKYRHGATVAACQAAAWNTYVAPFASAGYVQVRVEDP
jgi:hypothetical protein